MASINEIHNLMTTARAEHPVASSAIAEFIQAYKQAREDSDDGIREFAAFIALGSRIRSTVIRLIDIALALLVGAL